MRPIDITHFKTMSPAQREKIIIDSKKQLAKAKELLDRTPHKKYYSSRVKIYSKTIANYKKARNIYQL